MGYINMIYLTHEIEQNVINAETQISQNCHFPNGRGTDRWANIYYHEELEIYYITKPTVSGWNDGVESFTQEEMMAGVTGVEEREW